MSKHTPGPWTVGAIPVRTGPNNSGRDILSADGETVATVIGVGHVGTSMGAAGDADARLIAAAPDLLEALEDFQIRTCTDCDGSGMENDHDACIHCGGCGETFSGGWPPHVRAAIAKARGAA